jgi:hypothetical protein
MWNQLEQILCIRYGFVFETDCVFFAVGAETLSIVQFRNFQMIESLILVVVTAILKEN